MSSRNTPTNTPRSNVLPFIGASLNSVKLAHKTNTQTLVTVLSHEAKIKLYVLSSTITINLIWPANINSTAHPTTNNKIITATIYWVCIMCHLGCVIPHLFLTITPREKKLKWEVTCSVSYRKNKTDAIVIGNQVCLILVCAWLIKLGKFNASSLYQAKYSNLLLEYLICTLKFLILELLLAMYLSKLCAPSCTFWGKRATNGE